MTHGRELAIGVLLALFAGTASTVRSDVAGEVITVSLVRLIAAPEHYEGKRVRVKGFCHLEFEEQGLFLHREDADLMNGWNGVWLDIDRTKYTGLNEKFVLIEGRFTTVHRGHLSAWSGTITDVTRAERELTRAELELLREMPPRR